MAASNDCVESTNAGSRAPMVSNYSRCVVLGFGPAKLGTTWIIQQQEVELAVMAYWG